MMHGLALIINHTYKKFVPYKINSFLSWLLTFNFVNISFLMFRSESISDFLVISGKMFILGNSYSANIINSDVSIFNFSILLLSFAVCFCFNNSTYLINKLLNSHSKIKILEL
jgi:D-alanyl-lipoteichoic acid acyltransferase DltB (MBOAT superfamily)